jgi:hypothetical protein
MWRHRYGIVSFPFASVWAAGEIGSFGSPRCWLGSAVRRTEGTGDSGSGSILNGSGLRKGDGVRFIEDGKGAFGSSSGGKLGVVLSRYGVLVAMVNHNCLFAKPDSGRCGDQRL